MPLSNPTSRSEARPQDLADWTDGRALVATGSPFPPMQVGGHAIPVAQCNNVYAFPGIGLAAIAVGATRITDEMLTAAATAVGGAAPVHRDPDAPLLPARTALVETATTVARAVAAAAADGGVAPRLSASEIDEAITRTRWAPGYESD
jgi:malate dehydrogenase (oxaloacetate-decarboxylating)